MPTATLSLLDIKNKKELARKLKLLLAIVTVFSALAFPLTRIRAVGREQIAAADSQFTVKADPLLSMILRATSATSSADTSLIRRDKQWNPGDSESKALSRIAGVTDINGTYRLSLIVTLATADDSELKAAGFAVGARIGNLATVETTVADISRLLMLNSVTHLTAATRLFANNDLSRRAIGVDDVNGLRQVSQTGHGVVVAIIDDGIDFRHRDFTVPGSNGKKTRIKALLDMTVYNPQSPPLPADPNWNYVLPGATAPIGRLYSEAEIDADLNGANVIQQRNRTGHGTHVAGTAAGNGLGAPVPGKYAGVAHEADLVIVKASRQNDGTDNFLDADQINALAFVREKAAELNEPFVINMSMAGHFGPHDGSRANERAIDEIVNSGSGRAVCVSGGSTGDMHAHAGGMVAANGTVNLSLNVRNATQVVWLSYSRSDSLSVIVNRPDGVASGSVNYNPSLTPGFSNQYLDIYNTLDDKRDSDPQNDQKVIIVLLKPGATALGPAPHTWTLRLQGDGITNGHFDAWASLEGDFTNNIDDTRQTTIPGTARGGITVGGFVTREGDRPIGDYASFSSPGPTADGRLKPDISAPAFTIFSSKAAGSLFFNEPLATDSNMHVGAYGNSFATPATTGAVALLLQANPSLTTDQIKQILRNTATHDGFTGSAAWHPHFGAGKLNISAALNSLTAGNSIDEARFFVRQHYLDFLNRAGDRSGLDYWTGAVTQCGQDLACIHSQRIGVSAAFYIELEFQETGNFVYRAYQAAHGRRPTFAEFMPDRSSILVGSALETSKQAFLNSFVARDLFKQAYPDNLSAEEFVNRLFDAAQLTPYLPEREQEINAILNNGRTRAQVLRDVIEIQAFKDREYNPAFVLMQYFGYLRRNPDQGGYDFWLGTLNDRIPGNYRAMVCAFITSTEYQLRFGSQITRSNHDCNP